VPSAGTITDTDIPEFSVAYKIGMLARKIIKAGPKEWLLSLGAIVVFGVFLGLAFAGMAGIAYLGWNLVGYWVDLSPLIAGKNSARIANLVVSEWKLTALKFVMLIGTVFMSFAFFDRGQWWINHTCLGRRRCGYCSQWRWTEEDAELCCLTKTPTKAWIRKHKLWGNRDLAKYCLLVFVVWIPLAALCFNALSTVFKLGNGMMDTQRWVNILFALYIFGGYVVYTGLYKGFYRHQRRCGVCGVRADEYTSEMGVPLCSRCHVQHSIPAPSAR
jgi:hypothetical protein